MSAPDIFEYTSYREFLRDWYEHEKLRNPRFSHRAFARRLGSNDPMALRALISKRRKLSAHRVDAFLVALRLDESESLYFRRLVEHEHATDAAEARRTWAALMEFQMRRDGANIGPDRLEYSSRLRYATIRTLLECDGASADPAWLAAHVREALTVKEVADALDLLERLGLVVRDGDALRVTEQEVVFTTERVGRLASLGSHQDAHEQAGAALARLWHGDEATAEETSFTGMYFAVPSSRIGELRRLLYDLQLRVIAEVQALEGPRDQVIHVNVHAFPLTNPIADD